MTVAIYIRDEPVVLRLGALCAERPRDDMDRLDLSLSKRDGNASDLLDRPADQRWRRAIGILGIVFGGVAAFARWRITAIMAKASITSET
jgi:hypothetical protein